LSVGPASLPSDTIKEKADDETSHDVDLCGCPGNLGDGPVRWCRHGIRQRLGHHRRQRHRYGDTTVDPGATNSTTNNNKPNGMNDRCKDVSGNDTDTNTASNTANSDMLNCNK
jgi:hypothetical protein